MLRARRRPSPTSALFPVVAVLAISLSSQSGSVFLETSTALASSHTRDDRVRITAPPGSGVLVHGTYPARASSCDRPSQPVLHARYEGTVEIGRDEDGSLFVINELPFERYLEGIAEVPRTWPMAALRAQVVAARSYALNRMRRPDATGARLGYQLCATDACQVYRGMGISHGPYGERWRRAVRSTAGEVLVYEGRPADAVYSSTSPGYTLGNEEAFGGDPLPYLRPVREPDDTASPVSRWRAELLMEDVARFLRRSGHWSARRIRSVTRDDGVMLIRGGGRSETIPVAEFRRHMNQWASCLEPDRYPGIDTDGTRLPQTVPSVWFQARTEGGRLVLKGRGWGHGVGMVQWGAYGKARRGLGYGDILASYYGGLRPRWFPASATIRVGVAVGLRSIHVDVDEDAHVEGVTTPDEGPLRVGGGRRLRVRPGASPPAFIGGGDILQAPGRIRVGRPATVLVSVPQLSVVRLLLRGGEGELVELVPPTTVSAGSTPLQGGLPRETPGGTYRLLVEVSDGIDVITTEAGRVRVRGPTASPSPSPDPTAPTTDPPPRPSPATASPPEGSPDEVGAPAARSTGASGAVAVVAIAASVVVLAILLAARGRRRPPG